MRISLEDLSFKSFHGLYPEEKKNGNDFLVTVHIDFESTEVFTDAEIGKTIDYTEIYQLISLEMSNPKGLLEAVVGNIGTLIISRFRLAETVTVSVSKLNPPIGGACAKATITRIFNRKS